MRLVAVVLNWNGGDDTPRALESLRGVETICVDNGSTDGSAEEVERRFPEVELIRTGANVGFAGGNNVGLRRAVERGACWVLLLNNDAAAEPGLAEALERAAAARPDAGLLACKVLLADGETIEYAGAASRVAEQGVERRAGFAIVFVPDAKVRHKGSASTGGAASTANLYYDTRNTIAVVERHRPLPRGLRALRRGVVVGAHLAQAVGHPARRAAAQAVLSGWRDARRGRLGPR